MSIEGDVRTALLAMSAVTAYTGTGDSARIRPDKLQESDDHDEEHVIVEVDSEDKKNCLDGVGGLVYAQVNISCRAKTKALARALASAVRINGTNPGTGLAGYGGSGTTFDAVLEDETPSVIMQDDGSDLAWYTVEQSYVMSFTETT